MLRSMGEDVTNVLSRVTMLASEAPLAPRSRVRTSVKFRFEHTLDDSGNVDRLLFSTWLDAVAQTRGGAETPAARAYGQRVSSRPAQGASSGKHLVTALEGGSVRAAFPRIGPSGSR